MRLELMGIKLREKMWQIDEYREKLISGEIEGIVLHSNPMADLDYEAFEVAREWMMLHGDDEILD